MTNVFFDDVKDYNDLEIHDSWRKYVEESGRVSAEDMLRYISASGRDNATHPHAVGPPVRTQASPPAPRG